MDGMNIYYNYTVEVNNTEHMATLKEGDIHLYIGDKNIDYYFKVEKAQFTFRGTSETESLIESTMPSKAAVSVLKPNGDIVIGSEAEVVGSRIKWTVTPDLIDEDVEVGDFTLAISLIESSTDSMATLPPITNQVHIHERVTPTPGSSLNAVVNEAVVGLAQVQSDDTALDVFDSEGNYIKTVWKSGDKITQTKLNKIEDGLSGLSTQFKDIANNKIDDITLSDNVLTILANSNSIKTITLPTSTTGTGTNGREIELQKSTDYIQWRYVGDGTWNNLVPLSDLKGAKGDKGDIGTTPNLQIGTVETLASGSSATASITGTTENPLLNLGIPKGENGTGGSSDTLVTTNISGTILSLTTDKYQTATVVDGTEITLPTVTAFTEIHLFFSTTTDLTLILPSCKWQNGSTPTISANKTYEFIFTYTTEWLGGVIVYE